MRHYPYFLLRVTYTTTYMYVHSLLKVALWEYMYIPPSYDYYTKANFVFPDAKMDEQKPEKTEGTGINCDQFEFSRAECIWSRI